VSEARERSGIYGANVASWSSTQWGLLDTGRFSWVVIRTDCSPEMALLARQRGLKVVMQFPDRFNQHRGDSPAGYAVECHERLKPFAEYSSLAVLDNEPNLIDPKGHWWYADQFCRWYRAVVAEFRYQDPSVPWQIVFPAMASAPQLGFDRWLEVNEENIRESAGVGSHCYWYTREQLTEPYWGGSWRQVAKVYPWQRIFVLEYGVLPPGPEEIEKAQLQADFVRSLEEPVVMAAKFILGGTKEWEPHWLTERQAKALAEV